MMGPADPHTPAEPDTCPEDHVFVGVVEGTLSIEEARELEHHLDRCPDCAGIVAELAQAGAQENASSQDTTGSNDTRTDKPRLTAGQQLGRYTILEVLGEGGMGVVYSAYDSRLDRRVALKFMLGSGTPRERERLRVEARALARLAHPNVLTIHDIDEYEGDLFITTQHVEGTSVDRWLAQTRRGQDEILDVFVQAGEGLAAAHSRELVHRDVKPSNLLVGTRGRVFVADFGLVLSAPHATTSSPAGKGSHATERVGTPTYMAPEQLRGEPVDATADQYSFCVALYEALLEEHPFASDADRALPPKGLRQLPRRLAGVLGRGLSKKPGHRYPTMTALLVDIRPRRRRRWGAIGATLGAAGLAAVSWSYSGRTSPQQECVTAGLSAQTWTPGAIATTRDALLRSPHGYATPTWETLHRYLERHAGEWDGQVRDACEARWKQHSESDLIFDRRMQCLRRSALSLDRTLTLIQAAGPARALQIAYALPSARTCADPTSFGDPSWVASAEHDAFQLRFEQAQLLAPAGRVDEAEQELRMLLTAVEATEDRVLAARIITILANITAHTRPADEGTRALLDAVLWTERAGDDRSIAQALLTLTLHYAASVGDHARATETAHRAHAVMARTTPSPPLEETAASVDAILALTAGDFPEAIKAFETLLALYDRTQPDEPLPNRFLAVANLSLALQSAGRTNDALLILQTNIATADRALGLGHPAAVGLHIRLGNSLLFAGRPAAARDHLNRLRKVFEGEDSSPIMKADAYSLLARAHGELGDRDLEYEILQQVRELRTQHHPPNHPNVLSADVDLANNLQRRGDVDGSVMLGEQVVEALTAMDTPPPNLLVTAYAGLAQGHTTQGEWSKARSTLQKAQAMTKQSALGPDVQCEIEMLLGHLFAAQGNPDAAGHYQRARELFSEHTAPLAQAEVLFGLAKVRAQDPTQAATADALAEEADATIATDPSADSARLREQIQAWRSQ